MILAGITIVLEQLLPPYVASHETRQELLDTELFPAEYAALGNAVEKRRREFVTGRACARRALQHLGYEPTAIGSGGRGEPIWPPGVVGSITHCTGFRACAVSLASLITGLGIDAEPNEPLPSDVVDEVVRGAERTIDESGDADLGRLIFCAKEAVYKVWYPLTHQRLDFGDATVSIDASAHTFRAELHVRTPPGTVAQLTTIDGRWAVSDGIICATAVLPA